MTVQFKPISEKEARSALDGDRTKHDHWVAAVKTGRPIRISVPEDTDVESYRWVLSSALKHRKVAASINVVPGERAFVVRLRP